MSTALAFKVKILKYASLSALIIAPLAFAEPKAADGYTVEQLIPSSPFCGVHGLGVDANDELYAGSVVGQRLYHVDTDTGDVSVRIPPPRGMADDMEFLPDGTLIWTSISQNAVRAQDPDGTVRDVDPALASVNSIAYDENTERLFVAQVFGGDGLWQLDPDGEQPRREIVDEPGGLNGFDVGPDGMIYGPLWFRNRVVKIDPDSGEMTTVADGFHTPAAANFDSNWNLYVLDTATGEVIKVDIETGDKEVFVQLKPSLDNLAIDSDDTIYVSNMADNSIQAIDAETREVSTIVEAGLSCASGIAVASDNDSDTLYLADIFALRQADGDSGELTDIARSHAADTTIGYVVAVAADDEHLYANTEGQWRRYRRDTGELVDDLEALRGAQALLELNNGDLLTLSNRGSTIRRFKAGALDNGTVVTDQLEGAAALAAHGDNAFVSVPANNQIVAINLESGETRVVSDQLSAPRGIGVLPSGDIVVMESQTGNILKVDTKSGQATTIVENIPVGRLGDDTGIMFPGIAVGESGAIYAIADKENSVYKITTE